MEILNGLNYQYKLKNMISTCYQDALRNPFETFLFVVDNPDYVEALFFEHTHYLVNIEIMTWSQYVQHLIISHQLTKHRTLTQTEWIYHLRQIIKNESFHCFSQYQSYAFLEKFIPLLKSLQLHHTYSSQPITDNKKLQDFMHLYHCLQTASGPHIHMTPENILAGKELHTSYHHIYIQADNLTAPAQQSIIKRLAEHCHMTLLYTHTDDERLFNLPLHDFCQDAKLCDEPTALTQQLFSHGDITKISHPNSYSLHAANPQQEVKYIAHLLQQKVVDEGIRYQDFMIVYPDETYERLCLDIFTSLHIPHSLPQKTLCCYEKSYQQILKTLETLDCSWLDEIARELYQENLEPDYQNYLSSLFSYHTHMDSQEFKDFFMTTFPRVRSQHNKNQDQVALVSLDEARTATPRHIFFLGMNETILPKALKDTDLLLDEDIMVLRDKQFTTPYNTTEKLGIHYNAILKALLQPYLSLTLSFSQQTLSGESLLASSLYKHLSQLLTLQPLPPLTYISLDNAYRLGAFLPTKERLNHIIHNYHQTRNQPHPLSIETTKSLYSSTLSISQIETYNKCPFQYFVQYGLGIYPLKEEKLLPHELGSLTHYILSIMIDNDGDIDTCIQDYLNQEPTLQAKILSSPLNRYFIDQLGKDLSITLTVLKMQRNLSRFSLKAKEKKVKHTIQNILFQGIIDRIDEYQNYVSIIDYKSSQKNLNLSLVIQGFNIQMLLYLKMIMETEQKDPAAIFYFNTKRRILSLQQELHEPIDKDKFYAQYRYDGYVIDDNDHIIRALDPTFEKNSNIMKVKYVKKSDSYQGHILTSEQLLLLFDEIEKHIQKLYQDIINGIISILPKDSEKMDERILVHPCTYCPYHSVCGFDVFYNDCQMVTSLDISTYLGGNNHAL